MSESAQVLREAKAAHARGETPVLATVVAVRGSSYRKPGARMLVSAGRWRAGSISGGCLEADVVRRGEWLVAEGSAVLRTYDTSVDGDVALGCGGEVDVWLEPLPPTAPALEALEVVTVERRATQLAVGPFVQQLTPSPRVIIVGHGHDVEPVLQLGALLGWDVHVVDWRPSTRTDVAVHLLSPHALETMPFEAGCAVVIMSHHLLYDEAALRASLASVAPAYIGVLGPERRTKDLLARIDHADSSRVKGPIGLPLGGEGPAAVALSIVAQLQQHFSSSR